MATTRGRLCLPSAGGDLPTEKTSERTTPFASAVALFKAEHASTLTSAQVMSLSCLLSEQDSFVNQFNSFDAEQRAAFILAKLELQSPFCALNLRDMTPHVIFVCCCRVLNPPN